jgi:hypothetical protein
MNYPPTPTNKSCNCSDPCISTDDVYYAGPNLPNSGVNTNDLLTEVIEKLDAIYAVPTLQKVTEMDNLTTLPIIADSFVKIGGDGNNILLDDGTVLPIGDLPPPIAPGLQEVLDVNNSSIDTQILLNSSIVSSFPINTILQPSGVTINGQTDWYGEYQPASVVFNDTTIMFKRSSYYNNFILYPVSNVNNNFLAPDKPGSGTYTLATLDDIPATALVFLDEGNGNGIVRSDSFRDPAYFGNIGLDAFDLSWSDTAGNYGATGASSFAVGDLLTAQGYGSFLIGGGNTSSVDSNYTFQSGFNHTETGIGYANFFTGAGHSITNGAYATIVGQFANVVANNPYDVNDGGNTMFAVGNGRAQGDGTLQSRSTALQVYQNGRVVAPTLTTALINADTTGKIVATKEYVDSKRPYKVYTALLSQSGESAPVPTVLENTLGGTVVWTYDIVGLYNATLNGVFLPNKTVVFCTKQMPGNGGIVMYGSQVDYNTVSVRVSNSITNVDGELAGASIEIRVYN